MWWKGEGLAAILIFAALTGAAAQDFPGPKGDGVRAPHLLHLPVDWAGVEPDASPSTDTAAADTAALDGKASDAADEEAAIAGKDTAAALRLLNHASDARFPGIARSPLPVLLPAAAPHNGEPPAGEPVPQYPGLSGPEFRPTFFQAGPAGYDAVFELAPESPLAPPRFTGTVEIHITGASFVYELSEPVGVDPKPVSPALTDFEGLRRIYLQHHMRYLFSRHGAQYAVSILCFEGRPTARRLSCRDADPVAVRFLRSLELFGGMPQDTVEKKQPLPMERAASQTTSFRYRPVGELMAGTGYRRRGGREDETVYAPVRFPLAMAPAHVYSQLYATPSDCGDGRTGPVARRRGNQGPCAVGNTGDTDATGQPPMPLWRDNFCEARDFSVGQCPAGRGHQGQDIVPVGCSFGGPESERCTADRRRLVATQDTTVIRRPGQEGLTLHRHSATERIRFRYLHMAPQETDALGMVSGRQVRMGETIGTLSNFSRRPGGTSYHLHFDMQVFGRSGWVLVNPYMTLVAAYEHLTGSQGVLKPTPAAASIPAIVKPASVKPAPKKKPAKKKPVRRKAKSGKQR